MRKNNYFKEPITLNKYRLTAYLITMKLPINLIGALCLAFFSLQSYSQSCDTDEPTPQQQKEYFKGLIAEQQWRLSSSSDFFLAPLTLHIIRDAAGNGGITVDEWNAALDRMNEQYKPAKIKFYVCGDIRYIDNDNLYQFEKNDDRDLAATYMVDNTFNLFIVDNYKSGGSASCGFAYYPHLASYDMSVLATSCVVTGTTLEHELGHAFDLRHTHNGSGSELVARPSSGKPYNCDTDGDGFCDTPADPNLTGWTIDYETCEVTNTTNATDANGDLFQPDGKNIMSYSPSKACRSIFSQEQYDHMAYIARNHDDWTKMGCASVPTADFEVDEIVAVKGQSVQLFNRSTGGGSLNYIWSFNGANLNSSTDEDPSIIFTNTGTFDVTLTTTNSAGSDQIIKSIRVVDGTTLPLNEDFTDGSNLLTLNYGSYAAKEANIEINANGKTGNGLLMNGANPSNSPYYVKGQDDEKPFLSNPAFTSKFVIPGVDGTSYSDLYLSFDAKQLYGSYGCYTNMRVLVNGEAISETYSIFSNDDEVWNAYNFDLSAYDGTIFDVTIETNNKYDYNGTYFDNIVIDGTLNNVVSFNANNLSPTTCESVVFNGNGPLSISNYEWNFGDGAIPATAIGKGPHTVYYTTTGKKTITLDGDDGTLTEIKIDYITVSAGINQDPTIAISATTNGPSCSWTAIDFTSEVTNEGSSPVYNWKVNGNNVGSANTYQYTDMNDGDIITCELTSDFACASAPTVSSSNYNVNIEDGVAYEFYIDENDYDNNYTWSIQFGASIIQLKGLGTTSVTEDGYVKDQFCLVEDCYDITITDAFKAGGCSDPVWDPSVAYTTGEVVSFNGFSYEAKWWTLNHQPDLYEGNTGTDYWLLIGECSSVTPTAKYGFKKIGEVAFFEIEAQNYTSPSTHFFGNIITPTLTITPEEEFPICTGNEISINATAENIGNGTIEWFIDDTKESEGSSLVINSPINESIVKAKVTSDLNCASSAVEITSNEVTLEVDLCTSTNELKKDWQIYPNPTSNIINISADEIELITITNVLGQNIHQSGFMNQINLESLQNGVYFVQLTFNNQITKTVRVIKK